MKFKTLIAFLLQLFVLSFFLSSIQIKEAKAYFLFDIECNPDEPDTFCQTTCVNWGQSNPEALSWCSSFNGTCEDYNEEDPPSCFCTCTNPVHPIICISDSDCQNGLGVCSNGDCTYPDDYVCVTADDCRYSIGGPCGDYLSVPDDRSCLFIHPDDPTGICWCAYDVSDGICKTRNDCWARYGGVCDDDLPEESVVCGFASDADITGICDCDAEYADPTPPLIPLPTTLPQEVFCVGNDPDVRTANPTSGRLATAIGCIPVNSPQNLILFLLPWGAGIAGGIAFILIVYAAIMVITSAGDPKKLQAGKELLTAAIIGLAFFIFGILIVRFIGVNILNIPEFG